MTTFTQKLSQYETPHVKVLSGVRYLEGKCAGFKHAPEYLDTLRLYNEQKEECELLRDSIKSLLNAENFVKANQTLGTLFHTHAESSIQEAKVAEFYRVFAVEYCQNSHDPFTQFISFLDSHSANFRDSVVAQLDEMSKVLDNAEMALANQEAQRQHTNYTKQDEMMNAYSHLMNELAQMAQKFQLEKDDTYKTFFREYLAKLIILVKQLLRNAISCLTRMEELNIVTEKMATPYSGALLKVNKVENDLHHLGRQCSQARLAYIDPLKPQLPPPLPVHQTRVRALWEYHTDQPQYLSFVAGEILIVRGNTDGVNWWWAVKETGLEGWIPSNYFAFEL